MTVGQIGEITQPSSRALIERDGTVLYTDWFYKIPEELQKETVKEFTIAPEIRHKKWQEMGLDKPLQPEETPDYNFADLEMKLYYRMKI